MSAPPRPDLALEACKCAVAAPDLVAAQAFAQTAIDMLTGDYDPAAFDPPVSPNGARVLTELAAAHDGGGGFLHFGHLSARTGLPRDTVRETCRELRAAGLAAYETALWTEDGELYGSGYGATRAGRDYVERQAAQRLSGLEHQL